jgi:hypothetical protein
VTKAKRLLQAASSVQVAPMGALDHTSRVESCNLKGLALFNSHSLYCGILSTLNSEYYKTGGALQQRNLVHSITSAEVIAVTGTCSFKFEQTGL